MAGDPVTDSVFDPQFWRDLFELGRTGGALAFFLMFYLWYRTDADLRRERVEKDKLTRETLNAINSSRETTGELVKLLEGPAPNRRR